MARVTGLGHVGIFVRDLERMVAFYRDVMGMTVTKQDWNWGIVFLSADPEAVDHEIALVRGEPRGTREMIHQISLRVPTLADLRKLVTVVEDTAKAVQEQAVASDEIARNMDVVQRIAQDVLSSSEEAVTQGDHLHRLAHQLEESVKGFRIDPAAVSTDGAGSTSTAPPAQLPPSTGTGEARR